MSDKVLRTGAIVAVIVAIAVASIVPFVQQAVAPETKIATAVVDPRPSAGNAAVAAASAVAVTTGSLTRPAPSGPPSGQSATPSVEKAGGGAAANSPSPTGAPVGSPSAAARPASDAPASSAPTARVVSPAPPREPPKITLAPTGPLPPVQPLAFDDGNSLAPRPATAPVVLTPRKMGVAETATAAAEPKRSARTARTTKPKRRYARSYLPYPLRRLFSSLNP